jgi:hypothetical protein
MRPDEKAYVKVKGGFEREEDSEEKILRQV